MKNKGAKYPLLLLLAVYLLVIFVPIWANQIERSGTSNVETDKSIQYEESNDTTELRCLALNIYWETRNSNLADKFAVADVVLNRVESSSYPDTICEVVHQAELSQWYLQRGKKVPIKNRCQFSWYCDGKSDVPQEEDAWEESKLVAFQVFYYNRFKGISEGALMYHATYVNPLWAKDYQLVGTIGKHKYYRITTK